jgi:hypothetical protein
MECRSFLHKTSWSESAADRIDDAHVLLELFEWLTGADDHPPTYCPDTQPGDLVGGRERIVRPDAQIRSMLALAQAKLVSDRVSKSPLPTDVQWLRQVNPPSSHEIHAEPRVSRT